MCKNMNKFAWKGEGRNYWSSEDEQQARTGKDENSKYYKRDHGKAIKSRAPGAARETRATGTGGSAGAASAASAGFMPVLVGILSQPMLYFSKRQRNVIICCGLSALDSYADHLPGWIPAYIVVGSLKFNAKGIDRAVEDLQGRPYVWATEFENVHTMWEFSAWSIPASTRKLK